MSFRTASTTHQRQSLLDLQRTQERLADNQTRITSGSRITGPGDDPTASAAILDFSNSMQVNTQYIRQADAALSYLTPSETNVASAIEATIRLQELSVGGSTASIAELDAIRSNLLSMANAQSQGKYLFAGTATDVKPFTLANPNDPTSQVTYQGNSGLIRFNLDGNAANPNQVVTNIPGDTVFFGAGGLGSSTDIFQAITDLKAAFNANDPVAVQTVRDHLDLIFANLNKAQADLGGRQAALTDLKETYSNFNASLESLQSAQEATDYPKVLTEVTADETLQSVTLSTMAKANKVNLFDYLT
jgi:flagellar hook-associated protein 3 FlgL